MLCSIRTCCTVFTVLAFQLRFDARAQHDILAVQPFHVAIVNPNFGPLADKDRLRTDN